MTYPHPETEPKPSKPRAKPPQDSSLADAHPGPLEWLRRTPKGCEGMGLDFLESDPYGYRITKCGTVYDCWRVGGVPPWLKFGLPSSGAAKQFIEDYRSKMK